MLKSKYGCSFCGKTIQNANLVSFSKNRVHKIRRPNLHSHKMKVEGETIRLRLCTSCKRLARTMEAEKKQAKTVAVKS